MPWSTLPSHSVKACPRTLVYLARTGKIRDLEIAKMTAIIPPKTTASLQHAIDKFAVRIYVPIAYSSKHYLLTQVSVLCCKCIQHGLSRNRSISEKVRGAKHNATFTTGSPISFLYNMMKLVISALSKDGSTSLSLAPQKMFSFLWIKGKAEILRLWF